MGGIKGRKAAARLAKRIKAWDDAGGKKTRNNPGKQDTAWHDMHKPGSLRK